MVTVRYGRKNQINVGVALLICFGGSLFALAGFLKRWLIDCSVTNSFIALTIFVGGGLLLLGIHHLKMYWRESMVIGVSPEGLHLLNGKVYRFSEARSILPIGLLGFQIKFNDGWTYQPAYLDVATANEVFDLVKQYIESSSRKVELITNINAQLKKQHNTGAQAIICLSALLIGLPFLPFMSLAHPLPLILVGIVPLIFGLYKRFKQLPKTFDTLRGVGKIQF